MASTALVATLRDANGAPDSGGKIYAYFKATTTPQNVYSDSGLTTAHANPVIANSAGIITLYVDNTRSYTLTAKSADDSVTYWSVDYTAGAANPWTYSGFGSPVTDTFTADGTTTTFTLSTTPVSEQYILISIGGVFQLTGDYTLSGNEVTFDSAPPSGQTIEIRTFVPSAVSLALYGSETVADNNAALKAATGATAGQIAVTRGAVTNNDRGQGRWIASTVNPGVTDTGQGLYITSTGTSGIYWYRIYDGRVQHSWFEGSGEKQRIQRLLATIPAGTQAAILNATVSSDETFEITKSVDLDRTGSTFNFTANVRGWKCIPSDIQVCDLTANYTLGSTTLAVTTMSPVPAAGSWVKIWSDAVDPQGRDSGSNTLQFRRAQWLRVKSATASAITLEQPIRDPKGVSPISTAGDEALVDAYTTALNAKIIIPSAVRLKVIGGTDAYEDGHDADGWNSELWAIGGLVRPVFEDATITRGYSHGFSAKGCAFPTFERCSVSNLTDDTSSGQYGYGFADQACYGHRAKNSQGSGTRHVLTTSHVAAHSDETNVERLLGSGESDGFLWVGNDCFGGAVNPIDTHHGAVNGAIVDCRSEDTDGNGLQVRGREIVVRNFSGRNIGGALVNVRTDYSSGDPDDDNWTAHKDLGPTTCVIDGLSGECVGDIIHAVGAAEVLVTGAVKTRNTQTRQIFAEASNVIVNALCRFETSDFNGAATIDTTDGAAVLHADYESSLPHAQGILFASGADVYYDGTSAAANTGNIYLASAETTAYIATLARVRGLLNTDFEVFDDTYTNTISTQNFGRWVVSQAGDDDQIPVNFASHTGNYVETADNTGRIDTLDNTSQLKHVSRDNTEGLTATHGGSPATWAHTPDDLSHKAIDVDGGRLEVEISGTKSGTGGTATIPVTLGGSSTLVTATLPAAATAYRIKVSVLCTADNAQDVILDGYAEGGGTVTPIFARATATVNLSAASSHLTFTGTPTASDTLTCRTSDVYASAVVKGFAS